MQGSLQEIKDVFNFEIKELEYVRDHLDQKEVEEVVGVLYKRKGKVVLLDI